MASSGYCNVTGEYYVSLDEHHVIPKEHGGKNGEVVYLRPDIHQAIHRCAKDPTKKDQFLSGLPPDQKQKAEYLIKKITEAEKGSNKKNVVETIHLELDPSDYQKLSLRAKDLGITKKKLATAIIRKYLYEN